MLQSVKRVLCIAGFTASIFIATQCADSPSADNTVVTDPSEIPAEPGQLDSTDSQDTSDTVYFAFDSHVVTAEGQMKLESLAAKLKQSGTSVQVEGHCDSRGSIEYNLALGQRRADSTKASLVQLGVESSKISTVTYGKEKLAVSGESESDHAKNRRAEFNMM